MNKLGLYLHYPFCKGKCAYCDFYSLPCLSRRGEYEKALSRAIRSYGEELSHRTVSTVYFGGGTPSLISSEGLEHVFCALEECTFLAPDAEITMELNPESSTEALLLAARRRGINRLSFGMQSAREEELSLLGRLHSHSDTCRAVKLAKSLGFDNISLDLMYGLPGQKKEDFLFSLDACLALEIQHVSFYCLTLSPQVPLFKKISSLPEDEALQEMYLAACGRLEKAGFEHYEISNAALPSFRSRHNEGYWTGREYLGIGPGAHSFFQGVRFCMDSDLERFLAAEDPRDTVTSSRPVTKEDERVEYLMLSLRRKEGLDFSHLLSLSDSTYLSQVKKKLSLWEKHGLCRKTDAGYALTAQGFFVSNEMITQLI